MPHPHFCPPTTRRESGLLVGHEPLLRSQVVKKVWAYIKEHGLPSPFLRRDITILPGFLGRCLVSLLDASVCLLVEERLEHCRSSTRGFILIAECYPDINLYRESSLVYGIRAR
ncbi:hypothetical protein HN588_16330 [Candidatus Bathyarchaeota archaeon]|nr:hypothetical protein [Candidatus Bathyarchaeota archaeon]